MLARHVDQPDDVLLDQRVDIDLLDRVLHLADLVRIRNLIQALHGMYHLLAVHH